MTSRYSKGTTAWVDHPIEGRVKVVHLAPIRFANYPYTKIQAKAGDTMPSLAYRAYGDATKYWFIGQMNPASKSPDDIDMGQIMFIPTGFMW